MVKGTTKSGFSFEVDEKDLLNMEVVDVLADSDMNAAFQMSYLVGKILGKERKKALYDHLRDSAGRVPIDAVEREIEEIFGFFGQTGKNS